MITPVFILAAVLSLLFAASTFSAPASLPEQAADKAKAVVVEKFSIKTEKKDDKDAKKEARKFPLMFDIAARAQKLKAEKAAKPENAAKADKEKVRDK